MPAVRPCRADEFIAAIKRHLLKANSYTVIDLTGFTRGTRDQMSEVARFMPHASTAGARPSANYQGGFLVSGIVSFNDYEEPWGVRNKYDRILLEKLPARAAPEDREDIFQARVVQGRALAFGNDDPPKARRIAPGLRVASEELRREVASGSGPEPPIPGVDTLLIDLERRLDDFLGA